MVNPAIQDKRRFVRVTLKEVGCSNWFIATPACAADFVKEADDGEQYELTDVWMTPREFEALPDFGGF